tara:strand:- start:539 stop:880 length:342 start_codon:yes stop_codon:yes gene_type:complete
LRLAIILLAFLACAPEQQELFDRSVFEDTWWEVNTLGYNACFLVHQSGEIFIFEPDYGTYFAGSWEYEDPGMYHVESDSLNNAEVLEIKKKKDCWKISGYSILKIEACACTLL